MISILRKKNIQQTPPKQDVVSYVSMQMLTSSGRNITY